MTALNIQLDVNQVNDQLNNALSQRVDSFQSKTLCNAMEVLQQSLSDDSPLRLNRLRVAALRLVFLHSQMVNDNTLTEDCVEAIYNATDRSVSLMTDASWDSHNIMAASGVDAVRSQLELVITMRKNESIACEDVDSLLKRALCRFSTDMSDDDLMAWSIPVSKLLVMQYVDEDELKDYQTLIDYVSVVMDSLDCYL